MRTARLADVCTKIGSGATPRGGESVYMQAGVSLIRSQNVLDSAMKLQGLAHISDLAASQLSGVTVQPGDVLLNITGESVARCALVDARALPARVNQHVMIVRPNAELDARYLQSFLVSPTVKANLLTMSAGGTRRALTKAQVGGLQIPLPPIREQQAIAEVLGSLDDKIAANERIVALASELGAATFRASAASNTEVLSDVATIVMGTSPTGETMNEDGRGVPFQQGVRDFGVRFPSDRVWTTAPIRYASPGDVLLSVRAPVGRTNVADKDMCIGRGLAAIRSRRGTPWTLFHALSSVPDVWEPFEAGGTVFGSINKSQLASLEVPAVEGLVSALEARLAPLEERIAVAERESQKLADLRDALLPELMSGRLRVKDAEKTVEEVV